MKSEMCNKPEINRERKAMSQYKMKITINK